MKTKITFGDTVRVIKILPDRDGNIFDSWNKYIGMEGVWKKTQHLNFDGHINGICFMVEQLELVRKADVGKIVDTPKQICVKNGTIVNGIPIEKHAALQAKVADLTLELDALKNGIELKKEPAQPEIPDWIAPGKWVETVSGAYIRITKVEDGNVVYDKRIMNGMSAGVLPFYASISSCIKPFTPPPCPELPEFFTWSRIAKVQFGVLWLSFERGNLRMPLNAWIEAAKAHCPEDPDNDVKDALPHLLEIKEWWEKWGGG